MTLIELMLVVTIMGIMMALALPKFRGMRARWRVESAAQQLMGDLHRARVEAIKRNTAVALTRSGASQYSIQFVGDRELPSGVTFAPEAPDTVRFAAFGPSLTGTAEFTLSFLSHSKKVGVNAAGFASVQ